MAEEKKAKVKAKPKAARVDLQTENTELKMRIAELEAKINRLRDRP